MTACCCAFCLALGIVGGLLIAHYYETKQNTRDNGWARIVAEQQDQIQELLDAIADDGEVSAEELGYD